MRHRAEEALAADRVARPRLGSEVLVRLKVDDLAELREVMRRWIEAWAPRAHGRHEDLFPSLLQGVLQWAGGPGGGV